MRSLNDPVTMLAGVGAKRADSLASLGIQTIEDLLTYYPFRYEDIQERNLNEILDQEKSDFKRPGCFTTSNESLWLQKESTPISYDAGSCCFQCFFFQSTIFER